MKAKDLAQGRWRSVLTQLGIPGDHLDGKHHPCPKGAGEDRFRFADREGSGNYFCACSHGDKGGMALLMCCKEWSYAEAAKEVERVVGHASADEPKAKRDPRIALNRIRARCKPVGASVAAYLSGRGLMPAPGLWEARLTYWHGSESLGVFPVMVGLIVGADDKPQSYHLTYLHNGGKASVPSPRKIMTPVTTVTGGAVRLYPKAPCLGVAEGIETAIAAYTLTDIPTWAALTAGGVESFIPPADTQHLTIFGDGDASFVGQAAAYALAKRMRAQGVACDVRIPAAGDWNDELRRRA